MKRRWFALDEERGRLTVKMTAKMMLPMQHQSQEKPKRERPKRERRPKRRGKVISAAWLPCSFSLALAPLPPLQSRHHHAAPGTLTTTWTKDSIACLTSRLIEMMDVG